MERLLRGNAHPDDLTRLFLYARDRCDGRESVQEIGDFVAHHDERTKGLITRTARDWYITVRFASPVFAGAQIDWRRLPANFPTILNASFRRALPDFFRKGLGIDRATVGKILPTIIRKLITNNDGTLSISSTHNAVEQRIISYLSTSIFAKSAFDNERLFDDFMATMRSHGLLLKTEEREFKELKPLIGLFAVSVMHNCIIQIEDAVTLKLTADLNAAPEGIGVAASVPTPELPDGRMVFISMAIFSTQIPKDRHCSADLLMTPTPWDFDLEIDQNNLLARLG